MRLAGHADDVDDDAGLARLHTRVELARQIDEAVDLELPGVAPFRLVERLDGAPGNVARVIDQDIDARALLGEAPQRRRVAQIDRVHLDVAAEAARRLRKPVLVARGEMQPAAFRRKRLCARQANAFRPTGDED